MAGGRSAAKRAGMLQDRYDCLAAGWSFAPLDMVIYGNRFLGNVFGKCSVQEVETMRRKNFKGRCEKRVIAKCSGICRTYDPIQYAYADLLAVDDAIREIRCNVPFDGAELSEYTTDFVCIKVDGDIMVRECVHRVHLAKPMTVRLLDASREYWLRRGVADWGIVIDEKV
jgi:hypothetical protein